MKNKKFEPKIKEGKVNPAKEATLKNDYQDVVDFFINTTPYQHMFFVELIQERLTFFNAETKECVDIDEEYQMNFNGPFLQIPIK